MIRTRVMPCLLLHKGALVKTTGFKNPVYIGDPINSVRIYNEMMVDELVFLDITASLEKRAPEFSLIQEIASECFMPFAYGGGITTMEHAKRLFDCGVEKLVLGHVAANNPAFVTELAKAYGSQAVIVSVDVKRNWFGRKQIVTCHGRKVQKGDAVSYALKMQDAGAGEILLHSVSDEGTMAGFDLELIGAVSGALSVPVIALGGAGDVGDIAKAKAAGASAIGLGSMAVYQNKHKGILINFPKQKDVLAALGEA